jgi:hypothetical protein
MIGSRQEHPRSLLPASLVRLRRNRILEVAGITRKEECLAEIVTRGDQDAGLAFDEVKSIALLGGQLPTQNVAEVGPWVAGIARACRRIAAPSSDRRRDAETLELDKGFRSSDGEGHASRVAQWGRRSTPACSQANLRPRARAPGGRTPRPRSSTGEHLARVLSSGDALKLVRRCGRRVPRSPVENVVPVGECSSSLFRCLL